MPRVPNYECPHCRKIMDGISGIIDENAEIENGDLSICAYCQGVMQFEVSPAGGMQPRAVYAPELSHIARTHPESIRMVRAATAALRRMRHERG